MGESLQSCASPGTTVTTQVTVATGSSRGPVQRPPEALVAEGRSCVRESVFHGQWEGDLGYAPFMLAPFPCPCPPHSVNTRGWFARVPAIPVSWGSDLHSGVGEAFLPLIHQHRLLCPRVPDQDLCVQRHGTTWGRP